MAPPAQAWGSPVEVERRRRIRIALWAYAYEMRDNPLVSDAEFDREALLVQPEMSTGHAKLDRFFREEFAPHTGQWIYKHPELHKVVALYRRLTSDRHDNVLITRHLSGEPTGRP